MTKLFPVGLVFLPLVLLSLSKTSPDPLEILENQTFRADFEGGSVGSWSSYPPAQDTAYDPTIQVKKIEGNSTLSLVREINAWTPIDTIFGFRKKLNLFVTPESKISFRFYVKSYRGVERIIVKLGFENGSSKEISVPVEKIMTWQRVDLTLARELASANPQKLKAMAIMAVCRRPDPEAKLRLAIDDLEITGFREREVRIRKPDVHLLEELGLGVVGHHFREGERFVIAADFPVALKSGEVVLEKGWEREQVGRLNLRREQKNLWTVRTPELQPGLWRATVKGTTVQGNELGASFVFLVRPLSSPCEHPFLLFTKADLPEIQQALARDRTRAVWEKVRQGAAAFREKYTPADFLYNLEAYDEIFWLPTYEGYVRALHTPSQFIRENAVVYAISGDKEAGEAARQALFSISTWPSYVHPHILNQGQFTYWPVGLALMDFAMGYDMIYDLLSPEERKTIAAALFHKGVTEVFKEYVRDNRVSSNTSNWISHVTGGGILSALAISREYSEAELEPYLSGMIVKLAEFMDSTFDPDGYYGEGYYYHNFAMQSLSHSLPALWHHFGVPYPRKVVDSYQYVLYQQDNETGRIYEFGDAHDDLIPSSMSNFAFILKSGQHPHLLWLYRERPGSNYLDLLFPVPEGKGSPPFGLPLIKRLRMVGMTIFRSGFNHDDFVFIFKCGPFYNHQHFDQGSFFLADRGELFLEECGNSHYYEDPWYPRLYIQAGGHNCPLVGFDVESQMPGDFRHDVTAWQDYARITDFLDWKTGSFLSADLTPVYRGKWKSLRRQILYLKPRTILLLDRAEGASEPGGMSLRFHPPRREDVHVEGKIARIVRAGKTLYLRTLSPEVYQARVHKRPMSLNEFKAENPITMKARGFLELSAESVDGTTTFINVLSTEPAMVTGLNVSKGPGWLGITFGEGQYWISETSGRTYIAGDSETDAQVLGLTPDGLLLLHGSSLVEKGRFILKASAPGSFLLTRDSKKVDLECSSSSLIEVEVWTGWEPKAVWCGDRRIKELDFRDGLVLFRLPSGENKIRIEK